MNSRRLTRINTVFQKDLRDAIRDARVLISLIVPLGVGAFYNFTFDDDALSTINIKIAIAAPDQTRLPQLIEQALPNNIKLETTTVADQVAVSEEVRTGRADIGLVIPVDFDAKVQGGAKPTLVLVRSGKSSVSADYITAALDPALRTLSSQDYPVAIDVVNAPNEESEMIADRVGVRTWSLMLSMIMMLTLVAILAIPIVLAEEVEKKTIDALVLAMTHSEVVVAKALLGVFYVVVMTGLLWAITRFDILDPMLFIVGTGLTAVSLLALGLLLGGFFKSASQLNTWAGIFITPLLAPALIVGQPLPDLLNTIAGLIPTGAGMKLLLDSVSDERLFENQAGSFAVLIVWGAVSYALLLWQLKRRQA